MGAKLSNSRSNAGNSRRLRKKDGRYDKNGEFAPASWNGAFDIMAEKWKEALKNGGPATVGMFGSGQWTVCYAAVKPYKAGFRSNHIDPNARHCMASDMIVHGKGGTLLGTVSLDELADSMAGELSGVAVCSPEDYGQAEPELASPGASRAATRRAWEPACRIRRTLFSYSA